MSSEQLSRASKHLGASMQPRVQKLHDSQFNEDSSNTKQKHGVSRFFKQEADSKSGLSEIKPEQSELSLPKLPTNPKKTSMSSFTQNEHMKQSGRAKDSHSQGRSSAMFGQAASRHSHSESGANLIEPELKSNHESHHSVSSEDHELPKHLRKEAPVSHNQRFSQQMELHQFSDEMPLNTRKGSVTGAGTSIGGLQGSWAKPREQPDPRAKPSVLGNKRDIFEADVSDEDSGDNQQDKDDDDESQMQEYRLPNIRQAQEELSNSKHSLSADRSAASKSFTSHSDLSAKMGENLRGKGQKDVQIPTKVDPAKGLGFPARIARR